VDMRHRYAAVDSISRAQIRSFEEIWKGGYFGGDPTDPTLCREYGDVSLISSNFAVLQALVRPNITPNSRVVEIGPGRGAWSRCMVDAKELWCFDALSAEHNAFWEYVGAAHSDHVKYFQVEDSSLRECPDNHFDFMFSFGAFCHMPVDIQRGYQRNLFAKAKPGARGAIMFSDFDKFNAAWRNLGQLRTVSLTSKGLSALLRFNVGRWLGKMRKAEMYLDKSDCTEKPGRFFHGGIEETATFMESVGWRVLSMDVGLNLRDPIIYFEKPFNA